MVADYRGCRASRSLLVGYMQSPMLAVISDGSKRLAIFDPLSKGTDCVGSYAGNVLGGLVFGALSYCQDDKASRQ